MQSMLMQVAVETSVTRTLSLAMKTVGSLERLAEHLQVAAEELEKWMHGQGKPPTRVYMKALDLVANGPFSRKL